MMGCDLYAPQILQRLGVPVCNLSNTSVVINLLIPLMLRLR
jgi:hypothetical protein